MNVPCCGVHIMNVGKNSCRKRCREGLDIAVAGRSRSPLFYSAASFVGTKSAKRLHNVVAVPRDRICQEFRLHYCCTAPSSSIYRQGRRLRGPPLKPTWPTAEGVHASRLSAPGATADGTALNK